MVSPVVADTSLTTRKSGITHGAENSQCLYWLKDHCPWSAKKPVVNLVSATTTTVTITGIRNLMVRSSDAPVKEFVHCWTAAYENKWPLLFVTAAVKTPSLNPIRTESPSFGLCSLTLPSKNVSLVECLNSDKENGNDECETGTLHA